MTPDQYDQIAERLRSVRARVKGTTRLIQAIDDERMNGLMRVAVHTALVNAIPEGVQGEARTIENYLMMLDGNAGNVNTWIGRALHSVRGKRNRRS